MQQTCHSTIRFLSILAAFGLIFGSSSPGLAAPSRQAVPNYPCYRSLEAVLIDASALAERYQTLARWEDYGDSGEKAASGGASGSDLWALELTSPLNPGPKPTLVLVAGLHGNEFAAVELVLRLAETLLEGYGSDPQATWMLDQLILRIIPVANPDGRLRAEAQAAAGLAVNWSKNTVGSGCTAVDQQGTDLQRNFSSAWSGEPTDPCSMLFPGSAALSEPESAALAQYLEGIFDSPASTGPTGIALHLTANGNYLISPWRNTIIPASDHSQLGNLAQKISYGSVFYPAHAAMLLNPPVGTDSGTLTDMIYDHYHIPAYEFRLGSAQNGGSLMRCTDFEGSYAAQGQQMLLRAAAASLWPEESAVGPEIISLSSTLAKDGSADLMISGEAAGNLFHDLLPRAVPAWLSYSVDLAPWRPEAQAQTISLTPSEDYPEVLASFSFRLNASLMPAGRHMLYLVPEGQLGEGSRARGLPTAAFVDVPYRVYLPAAIR